MRNRFVGTTALLAGIAILYPVIAGTAAGQSGKRLTVPAGTRILIRMVDSVDSSKQKTGYRFTASLETNQPPATGNPVP